MSARLFVANPARYLPMFGGVSDDGPGPHPPEWVWVPVDSLPVVIEEYDRSWEVAAGDRVELVTTCPDCDGTGLHDHTAPAVGHSPCRKCDDGNVSVGWGVVDTIAPVVPFINERNMDGDDDYDETPCIITTTDGEAYYFAKESIEAEVGPLPGVWSGVRWGIKLRNVEAVNG